MPERPNAMNHIKDEYLDASANMRHYGNARFALLTLFLAIVAGLLTVIFGDQMQLTQTVETILKAGGVLTGIAFLIMEERASCYYRSFRRRAIELEKKLNFEQYTHCPKQKLITSTNAVRLVYGLITLFWAVNLFV